MNKSNNIPIALIILSILVFSCCTSPTKEIKLDRLKSIPPSAVKMTPELDVYPPILYSDEYMAPVPLSNVVNTAGAEDSPFIPYNSDELYFFFTSDASLPPEKQVLDKANGIYVSKKINGEWSIPEKIILQDGKKLSLDGCPFVLDDKMWFCSAREGYTGVNWFTAERVSGQWKKWTKSDFNPAHEVGELHISADGKELYFHSNRNGVKGGTDIWVSKNINGKWGEPENVNNINSNDDESLPYITLDGKELFFTRTYMGTPAIFRSKRLNNSWQSPELIISQFAGEPTLDKEGNIYFVHHFYKDGKMIEADIYVCYKIK